MTHIYKINGATCQDCLKTISNKILELEFVNSIDQIDLSSIIINLKSHLSLDQLNTVLASSKYSLSNEQMIMFKPNDLEVQEKVQLKDFIPLIVVFVYIFGGAFVLNELTRSFNMNMDSMNQIMSNSNGRVISFMNYLMGLWLLVFAMFKLFDLKGFADGYSQYDLIARKWFGWGFIYPFVEVTLGLAYLFSFQMLWTNIITLVLMIIGAIGVGIKLYKKEKFQCACLGTIFKIPLTQITLYEDIFMAVMALGMIFVI